MSKVDILLFPPECEVCGHEVSIGFLKPWNGKQVCTYCINTLNEEAEQHEFSDHN